MLEIVRGTTPNIACVIPYDVPISEAQEIFFTITQDDRVVVSRELSNSGITIDDQTILVKLTQDETLRFKTYPKAKLGIRIRIGAEAMASCREQEIRIIDINREGLI